MANIVHFVTAAALLRSAVAGSTPAYSFDPNTAKNCNLWYDNSPGDDMPCYAIPGFNDITPEQYLAWNPSLSEECTPWNTEQSYCVGVCESDCPAPSASTTTSSSSTTSPTSGSTPMPTQPGMIANCTKFYETTASDTCASIMSANNLNSNQFFTWNPKVGYACDNLWSDYYVCISGPEPSPQPTASTTSSTSSSTTSAPTGTPTPIQDGMVSNCKKFYQVRSGDSCPTIVVNNGITLANLMLWNPALGGQRCPNLANGYYLCIGVATCDIRC